MATVILLTLTIFGLAALYSSVGHAGASGYLAAMALVANMPQGEMKAVALALNILVGCIGTFHFWRAGYFHWPTYWPFAITSIPMAFLGGITTLPGSTFRPIIGAVLMLAALNLIIRSLPKRRRNEHDSRQFRRPPVPLALFCGAGLGFAAGLTGTGGAIFLSPLLLLCRWADPKRTAAVSVVFVLTNSVAGLGGVIADSPALPPALPLYALAAACGAMLGSGLGSRRLSAHSIRVILGLILIIAALKMFTVPAPPRSAATHAALPTG